MCSRFLRGVALAALIAAWRRPAAARELRVCADPNNLPFSNEAREGFENKIVDLIAQELGATVAYTWWAQRRGFLRKTLKAGLCDLVPGVPSNLEGVRTTRPYYRSTYVFVTRADGPAVDSFDDPVLREAKVGVQLVGDDGWNTPPAHALARRGIIDNVRGYTSMATTASRTRRRASSRRWRRARSMSRSSGDRSAGYFAPRQNVPLRVTPVQPQLDGPQLPMVFDIAMGVRKEDEALRQEIDAALGRRSRDRCDPGALTACRASTPPTQRRRPCHEGARCSSPLAGVWRSPAASARSASFRADPPTESEEKIALVPLSPGSGRPDERRSAARARNSRTTPITSRRASGFTAGSTATAATPMAAAARARR